jgi:exodeoxyribonuclease VII small subunit
VTSDQTPTFEEALRRLEEIVTILEQGDLPLAQSLLTFEEGVRLSRHCSEQLSAAEVRVETLAAEADAPPVASLA